MSHHDVQFVRSLGKKNPLSNKEERLIRNYLPLVRRLAGQVHRGMSNSLEVEDLIQIGLLALILAFRSFEDRGLGFVNYAKLRVRGAMIDEVRRHSNLSRSAMDFKKKLRVAKARLAKNDVRMIDEYRLSEELGMMPEKFRVAYDDARSPDLQSMDEIYSDKNPCFVADQKAVDDVIGDHQIQQSTIAAIRKLPSREEMILKLYFFEELSLNQIGKRLGIGAARVCQLKKKALDKIRFDLSGPG